MSDDNVIFKCLGEALSTDIKFIAIVKFKYYNSVGKEIKKKDPNKQIICLGKERIFLLQGDMQKIIDNFSYENIDGLEIDRKNLELFSIWVDPDGLSNIKAKKILVSAKFRSDVIKNIMCYYSIYYVTRYFQVKDIKVSVSAEVAVENNKKDKEPKKGLSKIYSQISTKNYE